MLCGAMVFRSSDFITAGGGCATLLCVQPARLDKPTVAQVYGKGRLRACATAALCRAELQSCSRGCKLTLTGVIGGCGPVERGMELNDLLEMMIREEASDLFLKIGAPPVFRVDGQLRRAVAPDGSETVPLNAEFMEAVLADVLGGDTREAFIASGEADAAYDLDAIGRFRVNAFRQRGGTGFVFRHIPRRVPSLNELNLPAATLEKLCAKRRGLVLVTGVAGSGKSTCLAAMVDHINANYRRHIITIEDPIEFVYEDKRSLIEQRELGTDTRSFAAALKHCVRQSPDVILIGEMRDQETMTAALNAAETGHLVLSTLHTVNAVQTVERIMGYFPPHLHELVRMQLSLVLQGVVSLRLLRRKDGRGRVPAVEILLATPTVREMLDQGRTLELPGALRDGAYFGTQTFGQALKALMDAGTVSAEEALDAADSPEELRLELKGVLRKAGDVAGGSGCGRQAAST